ncbi:CD276 antigen homolog isoform X1 [Poecilia formosa]|uniref:CD276 antigen homolog n=1 Tax=Poecilia formosa TaxID=48698 RepID=A0A096MEF5_POEFO|nr:PREDICTED: CD276 antigen homolog isoform X1 [Poecilia formosa]XP_007569653.1 PREDICTED: CD276 antigen homolog isoform X1 [Poecilia formosa]XP_016535927.1 PREDICTED: CD276 antigen homolog isoform X1 [Poecilia formosa]
MASRAPLFLLVICFCCCSGHAKSFIKVVCDTTITGQVAHQSMLTCKVETTQEIPDLNIAVVVWKKPGDDQFLSALDRRPDKKNKFPPGYKVTLNDRTVSLVITDPKVKDEGVYSCLVMTDSGNAETTTHFKVTAKYEAPSVDSIDEKVVPNAHKSLICKATGGYPEGKLRWFDEKKTEWTKSAEPTIVNQTEDGLLEISSKLPLMKLSTSDEYTCVVYNASDGKEGSATIRTDDPDHDPSTQNPSKTSLSAIIAPVLVIGSLIVGLLLALLICRRRSQQKNRRPSTAPLMGTHDMVPNTDQVIDPPPPYCEEFKDNMA